MSKRVALAAASVLILSGGVNAQVAPSPDGSVRLDGTVVPVSSLASAEGQAFLRHVIVDKPFDRPNGPSANIVEDRAWQDVIMGRFLAPMRRRYAVKTSEARIGGVVVDVVEPAGGVAPENAGRILLNVHGGGFTTGARSASLVESVPIAATMGIKVISIDYRMGPEFKFPAASEDVAKVYREILRDHDPSRIGLYGCSAGGMLTGESVAWFLAHGLPKPGAIGIFCASLGDMGGGDSARLALPLIGIHIPDAPPGSPAPKGPSYLEGVSRDNPLAFPRSSPALLAKFPPTLFITGTRAFEMSGTISSNNALTLAGVESELHVWDGMIHGFFYNSEMPESREAYRIIGKFFDRHLRR